MKQIYVGSTQRSQIYNQLRNTLRSINVAQFIIFALLVIVPIAFADKIKKPNAKMSPVVYIETSSSSGSAVYVGKNYFITAAHVVADLELDGELDLEFRNPNDENDNFPAKAKLIASGDYVSTGSPNDDYALICLQNLNADDFTTAFTTDYDENMVDLNDETSRKVTAIGYPSGSYSTTNGYISNKQGGSLDVTYKTFWINIFSKEFPMSIAILLAEDKVNELKKEDFYVVTGAKIWHGNSGGALIQTKSNKLLGITNLEFTEANISEKVENKGNHIDLNADDQTFVLKIKAIKKGLKSKGFNI